MESEREEWGGKERRKVEVKMETEMEAETIHRAAAAAASEGVEAETIHRAAAAAAAAASEGVVSSVQPATAAVIDGSGSDPTPTNSSKR